VQDALAASEASQPALALVSVEEVLSVEGIAASARERLRGFVTVLPEKTAVNANTASAEVLASQIAGLALLDARRLAAGRDRAYFRDAGDVRARLAHAGVPPGEVGLAVATRFFSVEGTVSYAGARLRARALLRREAGRLQVLSLKELE
jgi:general secretion pathway protein K